MGGVGSAVTRPSRTSGVRPTACAMEGRAFLYASQRIVTGHGLYPKSPAGGSVEVEGEPQTGVDLDERLPRERSDARAHLGPIESRHLMAQGHARFSQA